MKAKKFINYLNFKNKYNLKFSSHSYSSNDNGIINEFEIKRNEKRIYLKRMDDSGNIYVIDVFTFSEREKANEKLQKLNIYQHKQEYFIQENLNKNDIF